MTKQQKQLCERYNGYCTKTVLIASDQILNETQETLKHFCEWSPLVGSAVCILDTFSFNIKDIIFILQEFNFWTH